MNVKNVRSAFSVEFIPKGFRLLAVIAVLLLTTVANAQEQRTLTGVVVSAVDNAPIPGTNVVVKGTTTGGITDIDGHFSISVKEGDVIVFSFIGFKPQEVLISNQTNLNIAMLEDVSEFDEVVVVGYGVQQKKLVTGATVQVKGDDIAKQSTTSALEGLQGQTAGVQITSTSGQPGEGMNVKIRGVGTIGNSGPLYIVDGVQTGDISYLNNADIESIDILKDAASAAIYGSQAANGVVLITTKTGKSGKMNVNFDAYYGIQNPSRQISMLNSKEYAVIMNEAAINSGKNAHFTQAEIDAMGKGTDWIDEMIYPNAVTQNYSVGLNGGNDVSIYSMSMSYTGQEGVMGGPDVSDYNRYVFRVNTEHKLFNDIVKVGQHLTFSYVDKNGISVGNQYNNSLRGAFNTSPFLPMYDDNGNFLNNTAGAGVMYQGQEWTPWADGESNPYAEMVLNNQNVNNNQKLFGDVYVEIAPAKGLKIRSRLGVDFYTSEGRSYSPAYELSIYSQRLFDSASQSMSKGLALTWDNYATYDFSVEDHAFTAMAGMSAYENKGSWVSVSNSDLTISDLDHAYIDNTTNTDLTRLSYGGAPFDESMLLSYFGRFSYNYKERYMLNATFRADGSSRFAEGNRWGYFPSVSAGWVVTNENFAAGQDWMDFFKLRASWGQVGNQNISAWQYLAPISIGDANYYFGSADFDASGNSVGAYPSRLGNPDIVWETSEQLNIGFDARFLDARLGVNFDWYDKQTKDWLLEKPGYATDGADAPYFNGGTVKNSGVELALNWNDNIGQFKYFISANIAKNKNEVTEVPTEDGIVHGKTNELYDNAGEFYRRAETGMPVGYFWGWSTDGVFQNEAEIANYKSSDGTVIQPNAQPGDLIYVDRNDDGVIDDSDKGMVGDPNPDYTYGFNLGFSYKGFDFSVLANGVAGNQIVQSYRNHANGVANYTTAILDRWHGEGTSNTMPRVTETNVNWQFSDIYVQDGDFLRISNVTLGYDFSKIINNGLFKQVRLYATAQNLFTFTKYDGMDPEVGYGLEGGSSGVDVGFYPRPRTYLLGVNVKF
ncbi:TonB-dependent receptor [Carboxylicivirga sp. A043]|uniref:SusC/RagA family TonB-linked outer membrane protein n=1 Tax=Carboxylicivirga litoralis TaxID=2816963 RepID=UPI0021CB23B5|nr:TonB-dependent receptor [Carboxylicivirga sp. A043]MCU4157707.1 TonB-dependent receptor [Carboxylicivirga sp. A043]